MDKMAATTLPEVDSALFQRMVEMRRDLHRHPELGWKEHRTGDRICEALDQLGISYRRGVAKTGIVAELPGRLPEPFIALRADMDALPIFEETDLPFQSENHGVMHACGHDGHTSMLMGAAALLASGDELPLPIRFIFQPAEEVARGAQAMIEAGVLENVAYIFGGHIDRHYQLGTIAVTEGPVNASSDKFSIRITGKGGHAARPHETIDAVVVGSLMVMALQTIVSREVNPAHPSVVTVGRFDAGTASNVIAGQALLEGSIRAQDQDVRESLHQSIERMAQSIGQLHGADVEVAIELGTPVVKNLVEGTAIAREAAQQVAGDRGAVTMETANMGGEDFGYYLEKVPGCYVRFGTAHDDIDFFPAHSSRFDFDERTLAVAAKYYDAVARLAGESIANGSADVP